LNKRIVELRAGIVTTLLILVALQGSCASGSGAGSRAVVEAPFRLSVTDGFTIAVIPDTQCYTSEGGGSLPAACGGPQSQITNEMFLAQARYIVENRVTSRIVAAVGTGDIVMCGDRLSEWGNAEAGYAIIEATGLPYAAVMGNHDYDQGCGNFPNRMAVNYNNYFGPARLAARPWYGGQFPLGSNENFFIRFSAEGENFLVLALEFNPRDSALDWASQVISDNSAATVIITINEYMNMDGQRITAGQRVWDRLVSPNRNVILVLESRGQTVRRVDTGSAGQTVPQLAQGYQFEEAGGNGYMRLLHFRPSMRRIDVITYSPFLQRRRIDPDNDFTAEYGFR